MQVEHLQNESEKPLAEAYFTACARHGNVKVNTALVRALSTDIQRLDLAQNFVGHRGLLALLDVLAAGKHITHLCLRGNFLDNADVAAIAQGLRRAQHLIEIDLRDNPGISQSGGRLMLAAVDTPPYNLQLVLLDGTNVPACLRHRIESTARSNAQRRGEYINNLEEDRKNSELKPRPNKPRDYTENDNRRSLELLFASAFTTESAEGETAMEEAERHSSLILLAELSSP